MFVIFQQPAYRGPSRVEKWTGADLEKYLDDPGNRKVFVMCYTMWASNCSALSPMMARLSLQYSRTPVTFVRIDIGRSHQIAARLNISASTTSKQLPTFILFEGGKEIARLPRISPAGKPVSTTYSQVSIRTISLEGI